MATLRNKIIRIFIVPTLIPEVLLEQFLIHNAL